VIGTNNPGKQREYEQLLAHVNVELCTPQDLQLCVIAHEDGDSYAENARIKALTYAQASGVMTLADDSGLEVDALGGEPGLHSARCAGNGAGDADRCQLLLRKLNGVPWEERTARFCCSIALITPGGESYGAEGTCEGMIASEPRGTKGFGYDPIFYLPQYDQTMAQLPTDLKNRISHRGHALQRMMPILTSVLDGSRYDVEEA